jgi:hypothetical protein
MISVSESISRLPFLIGPQITSTSVSLLEPGSSIRIKTPCRGPLCDHIDICEYPSNDDDDEFICPVCGRAYDAANLEIDGFFMEILNSVNKLTNSVRIYPDGSYQEEIEGISKEFKRKPVEGETELLLKLLAQKAKEPEIIDLCD